MKKSICIETLFLELDWSKRFKAVKEAGFNFIEFWNWPNKNIDEIISLKNQYQIEILAFNGDYEFSLIDPKQSKDYLNYLMKSIQVAKKINCNSLTIHSNGLNDQGKVINKYEELPTITKILTMYENLKVIAKLAEKENILINLEALNTSKDHPGNFLTSTEIAGEMIKSIGSNNLKLLYDVYHMQLSEGSIGLNLKKYIKEIGHIHIADAPGRNEPGTGEISFTYLLNLLKKLSYKGSIGFELYPKYNTDLAIKSILEYF